MAKENPKERVPKDMMELIYLSNPIRMVKDQRAKVPKDTVVLISPNNPIRRGRHLKEAVPKDTMTSTFLSKPNHVRELSNLWPTVEKCMEER